MKKKRKKEDSEEESEQEKKSRKKYKKKAYKKETDDETDEEERVKESKKKNKKRKKDINPIKTNIYIDKDYPEDSDANTKSIKIKINSNKTKQLFKMVKINKVKKINIKNKIKKTIPLIGPQNNKNYSTDNVIERCKIKEKDMKNI